MRHYQIITDSGCDLPNEMLERLDLKMISLSLIFREQTLADSVSGDIKSFYDAMRKGETATTSAINPDGWARAMENELMQDQDVLVIAFSSGLSTTYQSAVIAAEELRENIPTERSLSSTPSAPAWVKVCCAIMPLRSGMRG